MFDFLDIGLFELLAAASTLLVKHLISRFIIKMVKDAAKKAKARFRKISNRLKKIKAKVNIRISWLRMNMTIKTFIDFSGTDPPKTNR